MSKSDKPAAPREERLKQALKANMARRKAQAKARAGKTTSETAVSSGKEGDNG
ncbi:hypothetical protein [Vannielia litorea]|uniref:hypothetical protein n=1 Tax=Vannielia TaxID=2813041 RepID=UPI001C95E1AF|nr:hypothetical protein [Vannielia litorea]MBY6046191.1 hypothetical protein [Vannielia litorea]MBY6073604.1 hypothetical protein [Vannielia litorea]